MGRPAIILRLELVCGRPALALGSALDYHTKQLGTTKTKRIKQKRKVNQAAGIEGQVVTMLKLHKHNRHTCNSNETSKTKMDKEQLRGEKKTEVAP